MKLSSVFTPVSNARCPLRSFSKASSIFADRGLPKLSIPF